MPGSKQQRVLLTRLAALAILVGGVGALLLLTRPTAGIFVSHVPTLPAHTGPASAATLAARSNAVATAVAKHPPTPLPTITPDTTDPSWVIVAHFSGNTSSEHAAVHRQQSVAHPLEVRAHRSGSIQRPKRVSIRRARRGG